MSEDEQNVIDDKFPCFVMEGSPGEDAAQLKQCDVVIPILDNTETKTRTEHTTPSTLLNVEKEPVTQNPFTLEEFLQVQREDMLCQERAKSVPDLSHTSTTTDMG